MRKTRHHTTRPLRSSIHAKLAAAGGFVLSMTLGLACDPGAGSLPRGGDHPDVGDEGDVGCTLTQGYWKNHDWPAHQDEVLCDQDWSDILWTPPKGDAWYILAHQWIAARLNVAAGAGTDASIDTMLMDAEDLLLTCEADAGNRHAAIDLAEQLDAYNNGQLGTPHCDDDDDKDDDDDDDKDDDDCACDDDDGGDDGDDGDDDDDKDDHGDGDDDDDCDTTTGGTTGGATTGTTGDATTGTTGKHDKDY